MQLGSSIRYPQAALQVFDSIPNSPPHAKSKISAIMSVKEQMPIMTTVTPNYSLSLVIINVYCFYPAHALLNVSMICTDPCSSDLKIECLVDVIYIVDL